jgi:hypothetical protein
MGIQTSEPSFLETEESLVALFTTLSCNSELTHLRGELCKQEAYVEKGHASVVVRGGEARVIEKVVREGVTNVTAVKLECRKADARKESDTPVEPAREPLLLRRVPGGTGVPAMLGLPAVGWLVPSAVVRLLLESTDSLGVQIGFR